MHAKHTHIHAFFIHSFLVSHDDNQSATSKAWKWNYLSNFHSRMTDDLQYNSRGGCNNEILHVILCTRIRFNANVRDISPPAAWASWRRGTRRLRGLGLRIRNPHYVSASHVLLPKKRTYSVKLPFKMVDTSSEKWELNHAHVS